MRRQSPTLDKLLAPLQEAITEPPVSPTIWPRRLFHVVAASSIPVGVLFLPMAMAQWLLIALSLSAVVIEVGRALTPAINDLVMKYVPVFKDKERFEITGATYLWVSAAIAVFAFEKEVAVLALLFLAIGDPLAALVGGRDHHLRIFGKSVVGSAAFLIGATAVGSIAAVHGDVPMAWWLVPGAFTAALAELVPLKIDDNLTIPLASGAVMTLLALI